MVSCCRASFTFSNKLLSEVVSSWCSILNTLQVRSRMKLTDTHRNRSDLSVLSVFSVLSVLSVLSVTTVFSSF